MGYYTRYNLTVLNEDRDCTQELRQIWEEKIEKEALPSVFAEAFERVFSEGSQKWYEYEEDMLAISRAFPDYIFQLDGKGEESGDIWRKYFYRGQMQGGKVQIIFPELDPNAWKVPTNEGVDDE